METYTGKQIDVLNMTQDDISIEDIAHSLALQCRFNGHCKRFYSIAQHSVYAATIPLDAISAELRLFNLLHDAAEAYLGDLIRPIKIVVPQFQELEDVISRLVYLKFCGRTPTYDEHQWIKEVDSRLLTTEARTLMFTGGFGSNWIAQDMDIPFSLAIIPWPPEAAERVFLSVFGELCNGR